MEKDDTLITAASITPQPDEACVSACYYVGWEFDHSHAKAAEAQPVAET
ncbi:MAG TPA: hypothetical protein VFV34_05125 [Blastocatellia bacterium]|nr:hypothetical protein [Blastocatellia bacterium]